MGLAGAAVPYEPAYATVNAYFDAERQNALLALTMVAGLASTIFVPASSLRGRGELYYRGRSPAPPGAFVADGGPPGLTAPASPALGIAEAIAITAVQAARS